MKFKYIRNILIILIIIINTLNAAQKDENQLKYTKLEVNKLLWTVKQDLDGVKQSETKNFAIDEIIEIEEAIVNTEKFLTDGKIDLAFYHITIAKAYFSKIEAKMELHYSKKILEQNKKKYK